MLNFKNKEQGITSLELNGFISDLDVNLPEEYKTHIVNDNGGKPNLEFFKGIRIHYFHSIKYGDYTLEEILEDLKDVIPSDFFPIANDEGGNEICISLNESNYGKVYMWYHGMDEEKETKLLANSLKEFLNGLDGNEDY